MANAFRPVNFPSPNPESARNDIASPATPRSLAGSLPEQPRTIDEATTPTRASFHAAMSSQKPLPTSPFPQTVRVPGRGGRSEREGSNNEDVEMDGSSTGQAETGSVGHEDIQEEMESDEDSPNADGSRSGKKKKSQRFYCTEFPPCNLSFTRSEHLARHIRFVSPCAGREGGEGGFFFFANGLSVGRKHTGERPFQCHCSRRFSRLDNLRQHAQTVHINEDIPIDSLAATGSRYQRQIRTDRVRPPTAGRARAATAGSIGAPARGHSKSLSTSSIASIGSVGSVFGAREDMRRRPAPLVMADHRARLSMESYNSAADSAYTYRHPSPGDFSTPTSATFSTNQSSPRWSAMASPTTSHSRSHSMFTDSRIAPGRRLSVPSGAHPFHGPPGAVVGHTVMVPHGINASNPAFSPGSTVMTSPTTAWGSRRGSVSSNAQEEAWRRRTWHPDSRNFNAPTSTLNSVANAESIHPNAPAPIAHGPPNPNNTVRLPGIESFITAPPGTPPKRAASPMAVDAEMTSPGQGEDRRPQWESVHRGLTRLGISNTPPGDGAGSWASETERALQARGEQGRGSQPVVRFQVEPPPSHAAGRGAPRAYHQHTFSAPSMGTSREAKRQGWYHGPPQGEEPQADGGDPRSRVERMVHPNVAAFAGFPAREGGQGQGSQGAPDSPEALKRLEALVAVATSEGKTATAY